MSWTVRAMTVSVVLTVIAVAVGTLAHRPQHGASAPVSLAAPLGSVDTTTLTVVRAPFCGRVPPADVDIALGETAGAPVTATAYAAGDHATLASGVAGIAAEDSCTWKHAGTTARAWVFTPAVTRAWARRLAVVPQGCSTLDGLRYGSVSVAYACGGTTTLAGLFGDAWLTCRLTSSDVARVGSWCVAVARAAGT